MSEDTKTPMTFREFVEQAEAVCPDHSINATVSCWRHLYGSGARARKVQYNIWDAEHRQHYTGATPEEALEKYRAACQPQPAPDLDRVGAIAGEGLTP